MWEAFKTELLSHYVAMAGLPWAKAHAWHQVNEFARQYPGEFGDLPEMLKQTMTERKSNAASL